MCCSSVSVFKLYKYKEENVSPEICSSSNTKINNVVVCIIFTVI